MGRSEGSLTGPVLGKELAQQPVLLDTQVDLVSNGKASGTSAGGLAQRNFILALEHFVGEGYL